jgi:hypothetical protein
LQEKRLRQEFKNRRILPEDEFLASPAKIWSTCILPESQDLFFRQESCIEGMEKESHLVTKKNKNLEERWQERGLA